MDKTKIARMRSRGGCIDCKIAKIKCDEFRPSCGTCMRRRRVCRGYHTKAQTQTRSRRVPLALASVKESGADVALDPDLAISHTSPRGDVASPDHRRCESATSSISISIADDADRDYTNSNQDTLLANVNAASKISIAVNASRFLAQAMLQIPAGAAASADKPSIKLYFERHPYDVVIGSEFVDEMNALTLLVLQDSPKAISDCIYSIGHTYLENESHATSLQTLSRRSCIIEGLKSKDPSHELEHVVVMVMGLCAIELIDVKCRANERSLPLLLAYSASAINTYLQAGLGLSSISKYFVRGLARQDMILSLMEMRRFNIPCSVWFDAEARQSPDRLMGYTTTLMPHIEELCILAEEIRRDMASQEPVLFKEDELERTWMMTSFPQSRLQKAEDVRRKISCWRPFISHSASARTSRRFLLQAYSCRSAALLYLHRLLHPAGSSTAADKAAFEMACEILAHLSAPPEELRLSLWPAFLAACELKSEEDRAIARGIFDGVYHTRGTATALVTKAFCMERVWRARDDQQDWSWMLLARRYPGECIPI